MANAVVDSSWKLANAAVAVESMSPELMSSPAIRAEAVPVILEREASLAGGDVTFNLRAEMSVSAFNSEDDRDTDGILMPASGQADP
jgi:hypothetical protein